jgi:hypothetical protein
MLYTYDPKKVIVTLVHSEVGPHTVTGYAESSFITVERDDDMWKKQVGRDGETTRSKSNNLGGSAKVKIMQTSQTNSYLNKVALLDETVNGGIMSMEVRDALGSYISASAKVWVKKRPAAEYDAEAKEREWVLDCADLVVNDGGSTPE